LRVTRSIFTILYPSGLTGPIIVESTNCPFLRRIRLSSLHVTNTCKVSLHVQLLCEHYISACFHRGQYTIFRLSLTVPLIPILLRTCRQAGRACLNEPL